MVEEVDKQLDQECEVTYEVTGEKVDSIEYNAGGCPYGFRQPVGAGWGS
ncbi:hypothetical protein [Streptomyces hirsutus]